MKKITFILIAFVMFSSMKVQGQTSEQKVLLEVFTGAWSQFSPDAAVVLEEDLLTNPNVFAINIHDGDAMSFSDGDIISSFYSASYPTAIINREGPAMSRSEWLDYTNNIILGTSVVTVSFDSVRLNTDNGMLDVYIKASFTGSTSGDLRFNCVLVEDQVIGDGSGYDQVNYYHYEPDHFYYGAGNPIIGYHHRYVARTFMGGAWGVAGEIPASVSSGEEFTCHLTTTVPANYDVNELSLIAMVSRYDGDGYVDHVILNVERCNTLFPPTSNLNSNANTICKGETITYTNLSSNDATSWHWEFEGGVPATSDLQNPGAITYPYGGLFYAKLTATGVAGSDINSLIVLVDSVNTQVSLTETSIIAVENGASYQWYTCNGSTVSIEGATSQEYIVPVSGFYSVEIDNGNCSDMSVCYAVTMGSVDDLNISKLKVYPNPTTGEITIECADNSTMTISDMSGKTLLTESLNLGVNHLDLQLIPGMYLLNVITDKMVIVNKLVVE